MYVNIGAPSRRVRKGPHRWSPGQNPCPLLEKHGGIWRFDENKAGQSQENGGRRYATGMRQFYALAWNAGALYAMQHGRDQLDTLFPQFYDTKKNAELPSEELLRIEEGSNFGWPYCYHDWQQGKRVQSPEYGGDGTKVGVAPNIRCRSPRSLVTGRRAGCSSTRASQFPARYQGGVHRVSGILEPRAGTGGRLQRSYSSQSKAARHREITRSSPDGFAGVTPLMKREEPGRGHPGSRRDPTERSTFQIWSRAGSGGSSIVAARSRSSGIPRGTAATAPIIEARKGGIMRAAYGVLLMVLIGTALPEGQAQSPPAGDSRPCDLGRDRVRPINSASVPGAKPTP
jgi:hypothetical protein